MGKVNALTHLFNAGEISRAALNRVDKEIIRLHAERQENLMPYAIGKAIMRPGFQFLDEAYEGAFTRLIPFVKGVDDTALIEMSNGSLRVRVDDEIITRVDVEASVTNGDFDSATGWTLTTTAGGSAAIANGALTLAAPTRGGSAAASQEVETGSVGEVHALRIDVARGPVTLRVGASDGGDEYIRETALDAGVHSLAFQHTGITAIDDNTILLLHFDGADGSSVFTDSSSFGHIITANGGVQIGTAQSKFGGASAFFDGSGDYLSLDGGDDFAFGSRDFTVDFWARFGSSSDTNIIYDSRPNGISNSGGDYLRIYLDTSNRVRFDNGTSQIISSTITGGPWYHVAVTRSEGISRLFLNGVSQGSVSDGVVYLNGTQRPAIGANGTSPSDDEFPGYLDELRVSNGIARWTANFTPPTAAYSADSNPDGSSFYIELSSKLEREVVVNSIEVEDAGELTLSAPWSENDLREIQYAQEEDVIFLAHGNWQARKIERRGTASWSIVKYETDDGPFTVARTAAVKLNLDSTRGNVTLTSDAPFFRADHVGALFRLNHERTERDWSLGADETFTDAFRLRGIGDENDHAYVISGTWVGTIRLQRSYDGADSGFADTASHTINASATHAPDDTYDNQIFWQRYGFKNGEHTSGTANISVTYSGYGDSGVCRITSFTSDTEVEAEVLTSFTAEYPTDSWLEGEWSDRRGWPEAVSFFDGRLWWARGGKFWGSESNGYYAFNLDTEGDAGSIQRFIASGGAANETHWIMGLQRLMLGTNAAPMSCRSSSFDEPLTPTNITVKQAATEGAARLSPAVIGSRGIYISSDLRRLFELAYDVDAQDYLAKDLTRLHEDLSEASNPDIFDDAFVELAYQNSPVPYVHVVRDDGVMAGMLFSPAEEARGIFRIVTGRGGLDTTRPQDRIVSVAVLPRTGEDQIYICVERTIDDGSGSTTTSHYIEKMAYHKDTITRVYDSSTQTVSAKNGIRLADSYITATGLGGIGQVFTGLDHLEGRDVIIIGQKVDGGFGPTGTVYMVADGQIATEEGVEGTVCIGLPYDGFYKSAKLAFAAQQGTALLQTKRIEQLGLALLDTHPGAIRVGPSFETDEMDSLPGIGGDGLVRGDITLFDRSVEEAPFPFNGYWDTDSRVCLKILAGHSATLSAMTIGVETKEK
jgi:hypothetical protein